MKLAPGHCRRFQQGQKSMIVVETTDRGQLGLTAMHLAHEQITDDMVTRRLGSPVNLCYVDEASGRLIVGVSDDTMAIRRSVTDLVGDIPLRFFPCAPAARHANKRGLNRPLIGGIYISRPEPSGRGEGTVCIGALRESIEGFVTCGHVVGDVGNQVYQPRKSEQSNWLVGQVAAVSNYGGAAASDSAFVTTANGVHATPNAIWKSSSTAFRVIGIYDAPGPGTAVSMQGAATATALRSGLICGKNVTVTFADGGVLDNQLLANYLSQEGDSGAPVFFALDSDSSVLLIGLNVGATEPQYAEPEPDPDEYPPANSGAYAVISPWRNVEQNLGLTLGLPAQTP